MAFYDEEYLPYRWCTSMCVYVLNIIFVIAMLILCLA
jgi:hypothetical protein